MKFIGDRISIQQKEKDLSIVILSFKDELKSKFLLLWVVLWSICGIAVLSQYPTLSDPDIKTAIIVWMGFWAYFEYKIIAAYKWRKSGKEKIKIKDGNLFYLRSSGNKGKFKKYKTDFIKELRFVEPKENSFFENLNESYWMIGNERIGFDYYGADIKFGIQLSTEEARELLNILKRKIKEEENQQKN